MILGHDYLLNPFTYSPIHLFHSELRIPNSAFVRPIPPFTASTGEISLT
jgi:hypothetical protein